MLDPGSPPEKLTPSWPFLSSSSPPKFPGVFPHPFPYLTVSANGNGTGKSRPIACPIVERAREGATIGLISRPPRSWYPRAPVLTASLCPLPVGVLRWRGPTPRITVIVKATYSIERDGTAELLAAQPPLSLDVPDPHGNPSALWYPSDFVPRKARADVTLVGGAFADPASALIPVQLLVDGLERRLVARAGVPSPYIPLSESYLHASLARNAATMAVGPRSLAARDLGDTAASIDAWGLPAAPLGSAFDFGTFNSAPRDQQIASLSTGTSITLVGTVRGGERRTVRLPGHRPRAFHAGAGGAGATPNEIALTADTLWIDSYGGVCALVWRGEIALDAWPEPPHEILLALEQGSAQWSWPQLRAALPSSRRDRAIEPADLGAIPADARREPEPAAQDRADDDLTARPENQTISDEVAFLAGAQPATDDEIVEVAGDELLDAPDDDGDEGVPTGRPPPPEIEIEIEIKIAIKHEDEDEPTPAPEPTKKPAEERTGLVDLALLRRQSALPFAGEPRRPEPAQESTGLIDLAQLRASKTLPFHHQRATSAAIEDEPHPPPNLSALPFDRPRRRNDPLIRTANLEERPRDLAPATPFERPHRRNDPLIQTANTGDRPRAFVPATPFERAAAQPPRDDAPRAPRTDALPFSPPPAAIAPVLVPPRETTPRFVPEVRFIPSPVITSVAPAAEAPANLARTRQETPLLPLETYATIKAELWRRSPLALPAVTVEHGLTEVEWLTHDLRYREAIDAQAREGTSVIAASVARAMARAKRARDPGDDLDLAGYLALKSEIEASGDATGTLKKRGLTRRALRRIERRFQLQIAR